MWPLLTLEIRHVDAFAVCWHTCKAYIWHGVNMLRINDYPQLRFIAWNRPGDQVISEEEAFALYERNWRYVELDKLEPSERDLIDRLTREIGHGHLHV